MGGFNHSVKVPAEYKKAALILKKSLDQQKSVKGLVFEQRHARISNLYGILTKYGSNKEVIEDAIDKSGILVDNPRFDPHLCRILVTQLLFGTKALQGQSKPILTVLSYKDKLLANANFEDTPSAGVTFRYVRINTNLLSQEEAFKVLESDWRRIDKVFSTYDEYLETIKNMEDDQYVVDMHVPTLLVFTSKWKYYWAHHEYVSEKKFLLQDKATCIPSQFLNPKPNSVVLDMCAAPGMKTLHLSNVMNNSGTIYSIERDVNRYKVLCDYVKESKATSVKPINADALNIGSEQVPGVKYILVDPSCSGSGMRNRLSLTTEVKDMERLSKLGGFQIKLLTHAMTNFPDVERIVYSTCSLYEEENEQVIRKCLKERPEFKLLNAKKLLERKWNNVGNKFYEGVGKNCIYSLPDLDFTDGVFIAVLEKLKAK